MKRSNVGEEMSIRERKIKVVVIDGKKERGEVEIKQTKKRKKTSEWRVGMDTMDLAKKDTKSTSGYPWVSMGTHEYPWAAWPISTRI